MQEEAIDLCNSLDPEIEYILKKGKLTMSML